MKSKESGEEKRAWAARGFTLVEDVVYIGLGLLLAGSSIALVISLVLLRKRGIEAVAERAT